MSATQIANAYVSLHAQFGNKQGDLTKQVEGELGGVESSFDDAGAKGGRKFNAAAAAAIVAGAVVVATAVAVVTSKAVMAFGELEQNIGGSEAVFGQYASTIQQKGVEAYKNLGLSQSDYLATANKMGALFQGSGIEQVRALDLTTQAMQRAADMASVMGIDQTIAMESVAGAAKGNFTMMDNLGVAMNATNIEAYALSKGMADWSFATATAAEKAEMAMAMFMDSTSQYAGNFAREATETVTGSIGLMGAAWDSLLAGFGDKNADMSQLTTNLVEAFKAVVKNVAPVVGEIFASLPEVFSALASEIGPLFEKMFAGIANTGPLGALIAQIGQLWQQFSPLSVIMQIILPLLPQFMALFQTLGSSILPVVTALAGVLQGVLASLVPIFSSIIAAVIPIIEAILPILIGLFEQIIPIVLMLVEAFVPLLAPILALIAPLIELIGTILPPLIELFGVLLGTILPPLQLAIGALIPIITGVVSAISSFLIPIIETITDVLGGLITFLTGVFTGNWEQAWEGIKQIFSGVWDGVQNIARGSVNMIIDLINGVIGGINGVASGLSEITGGAINLSIPKIPRLAEGGIVKARPGGIIANIGEGRYDEAVVPLSPAVLGQLGGGTGMPSELVVRDVDGALVGRMRVEAGGVLAEAVTGISREGLADELGTDYAAL